MLTVVTPASSARLTTVARARSLIGFSEAQDQVALVCIDQASRAVADFCRRPFGLETVREDFEGGDLRAGVALLSRSPVASIVSVTAGGIVLDASGYQLDHATGHLYRIEAGEFVPWCWGRLVVEYTAGYVLPSDQSGAPTPTLPEPVERAVILLAGAYLGARGRDPMIKAESVDGVGSLTWFVPGADSGLIAPEAEQLLQPYRRLFP